MGIFLKKRVEEQPVNLATVARMFGILPRTFYYRYRHYLSACLPDKEHGRRPGASIATVNKKTGEIKEKPLYVFKEENTGGKMGMDDRAIGHDGFTVNIKTTKKVSVP